MPRVPLLVSLALLGMALAVSAWLYPALPDVVPTHWNIKGEADGFGPKGVAAWLLPMVALGLLGFMCLIPWLSPQGFQVDVHSRAFSVLLVALTALMVFIHLLSLAAAMRPGRPRIGVLPPTRAACVCVCVRVCVCSGSRGGLAE